MRPTPTQVSSGLKPLLLQVHNCHAAPALFRGRGLEPSDERVRLEVIRKRAPQLTGAVPVDQAYGALVGDRGLIEKLLGSCQRFLHSAADHVQVAQRTLAWPQVDIHLDAPRRRWGSPVNHAQIAQGSTKLLA